jgi:hypothetical protein
MDDSDYAQQRDRFVGRMLHSARVTFEAFSVDLGHRLGNYAALATAGPMTAFECIHDMADPVGVQRTMLNLAGGKGTVFVMDERVADRFAANGSEVEQIFYGFSLLHCLPVGMSDQPSAPARAP